MGSVLPSIIAGIAALVGVLIGALLNPYLTFRLLNSSAAWLLGEKVYQAGERLYLDAYDLIVIELLSEDTPKGRREAHTEFQKTLPDGSNFRSLVKAYSEAMREQFHLDEFDQLFPTPSPKTDVQAVVAVPSTDAAVLPPN